MRSHDVEKKAREIMAPVCRVCKECNGKACRGEVPGAGGVGSGEAFVRSVNYLKGIEVVTDYLHADKTADTTTVMFGHTFKAPVFAAPIAGMNGNYNGYLTEKEYAEYILSGCRVAGTVGFTGDGSPDHYFNDPLAALTEQDGWGIPTIKPWQGDLVFQKMDLLKKQNPIAIAMDIDGACYRRIAERDGKPTEAKSAEQIAEYAAYAGDIPFIVKGILRPRSAVAAFESGAAAVVVSSHGGRANEASPAPASMLPAIRNAVGRKGIILVDGGIRTGTDIFKAVALGADGVLIGRPYTVAAHGGGAEGVTHYTLKKIRELEDIMMLAGCSSLKDIHIDLLRNH